MSLTYLTRNKGDMIEFDTKGWADALLLYQKATQKSSVDIVNRAMRNWIAWTLKEMKGNKANPAQIEASLTDPKNRWVYRFVMKNFVKQGKKVFLRSATRSEVRKYKKENANAVSQAEFNKAVARLLRFRKGQAGANMARLYADAKLYGLIASKTSNEIRQESAISDPIGTPATISQPIPTATFETSGKHTAFTVLPARDKAEQHVKTDMIEYAYKELARIHNSHK